MTETAVEADQAVEVDSGALGAFEAFIRLPIADQLRLVRKLSHDELVKVTDVCFAYGRVRNGSPVSLEVLAAILWTAWPEEYDPEEQDSAIRRATSQEALLQIRLDTYESKIQSLLHLPEHEQEEFIRAIPTKDKHVLLDLIDKYGKKRGFSTLCRSLMQLVYENMPSN